MGTIISLIEAQTRIKRWINSSVKGSDFKASMVSQADLEGLISEIGENGIRAYNGIDANGEYKLMIVAVDAKGNDLINDAKGYYIYDFTSPCPSTCDVNSPLYTLL